MKRIVATLLVLVIALGMVGCGDSKNKEKLVGMWTYETGKASSAGLMGFDVDKTVYEYIFDLYGNCARIYTYASYYYYDSYQPVSKRMIIETGRYKMDDKEITISFTDKKTFDADEETIEEEKISKEEIIPYYMNEYNNSLIFYSDSTGKSNYEYSSLSKSFDESISYYENEFWPKFK